MKPEKYNRIRSNHWREARPVPIRWGLRSWEPAIIRTGKSVPADCNQGQIHLQRKMPVRRLTQGIRTLSLINLNESWKGLALPGLRSFISLVETPFKLQEQN